MKVLAKLLLALVLIGAMTSLLVMLATTSAAGVKSLERYAGPIRAGAVVSADVGGAEAEALTAALRKSKSITVSNFQAQHETACFWVDLGEVSARFELRESGDDWEVVHASLTRECDCPEAADEPCHLE